MTLFVHHKEEIPPYCKSLISIYYDAKYFVTISVFKYMTATYTFDDIYIWEPCRRKIIKEHNKWCVLKEILQTTTQLRLSTFNAVLLRIDNDYLLWFINCFTNRYKLRGEINVDGSSGECDWSINHILVFIGLLPKLMKLLRVWILSIYNVCVYI